jgi:hypothetical protein
MSAPIPPEFEPDKWLYVIADNPATARRFFGASSDWPVEFDHFDPRDRGRVWRVKAEGLVIK